MAIRINIVKRNPVFRIKRFINRFFKKSKRMLNFKKRHEIFRGRSKVMLTVSTVDLVHCQFKDLGNGAFNIADVIVRLISARDFTYGKSASFDLYRKMQMSRIGEDWSKRFELLISKIVRDGFSDEYPIKVDRKLTIIDGSHRLALAILLEKKFLKVEMINESHQRDYDLGYFWSNGFDKSDIEKISWGIEEVLKGCEKYHYCIIWPPAADYFDDIISDFTHDGFHAIEVMSQDELSLPKLEAERFIRAIYSTDDISLERLNTKIKYLNASMSSDTTHFVFKILKLKFDDCRFKVKGLTGQPQNIRAIEIKGTIRNRYKNKILNYEHDVICHVSDNHLQNIYLSDIIHAANMSLTELFASMADYEYFVIKWSEARQAENFPTKILLKSDVDIVVAKRHFKNITIIIEKFLKEHQLASFHIKKIDEATGVRYRLMCGEFLIIQFDVKVHMESFSDSFVEELLRSRGASEFKYLDVKDEVVFRLDEYIKHPVKYWHKNYLVKYSRYIYQHNLANIFNDKRTLKAALNILERLNIDGN